VKEKPILFNGEMVRAILDGRKAQTRRVIKPQPVLVGSSWEWEPKGKIVYASCWADGGIPARLMPYGAPYQVGQKLWVRETWVQVEAPLGNPIHKVVYRADCRDSSGAYWSSIAEDPANVKWRPSIFMPKWATRLWLEVTGVRAERVQDISEDDAEAEGSDSVLHFSSIWDTINQARGLGWAVNPWCWCVSFRRKEHETEAVL